MQDRLRKAAGKLLDKAKDLVPGHDDAEADEDEDLPAIEAGEEHADLAVLDDEDGDAVEISEDRSVLELLASLDPVPPLPLTARHEVGLASLLDALGREEDSGLVEDKRVRRILDLVGDRASLAVGPDGITVRSLLRRRRTAWKHVGQLTFTSRVQLVRGGALERITEDVTNRLVPVPVPGLRWLVRRMVGGLTKLLDKHFRDEHVEALEETGFALTHVERRGFDIEISGPLLLVSLLATGFSQAVEAEARDRKVQLVYEG